MRGIWEIYKRDWTKIVKVPTGILLVIAIALLPCLYAWVNIKSVWDPYANTQGVSVAVSSEDKGVTLAGKEINIGSELMKSLAGNPKLGWVFVTKEEAEHGVETGDYYASIVIPEDFSTRITGIVEGRLDRPEVIYTVNEKVNAIAPKITSSGVSTIANQINESFTEAVTETLLSKLAEIGFKLEEQLPTLRKVEHGILDLEQKLPDIALAGQKIVDLEQKLPELREKANIIIDVQEKFDDIHTVASYVTELNKQWPRLQEMLEQAGNMQEHLAQLQGVADHIGQMDEHMDHVEELLLSAADKAQSAITVVHKASVSLERITELAAQGGAFTEQLEAFFVENEGALELIAPLLQHHLQIAEQATHSVTALTVRLLTMDTEKLPTVAEVKKVNDIITHAEQATGRMASLLTQINKYLPQAPFQSTIEQLETIQERMVQQSKILTEIEQLLAKDMQPAKDKVMELQQASAQARNALATINGRYDSEIVPNLTLAIEKMKEVYQISAEDAASVMERMPELALILESTETGLTAGLLQLEQLIEDFPQLREQWNQVAETIQSKLQIVMEVIEHTLPKIADTLPLIGEKLAQADQFVQEELPKAEEGLIRAADFITEKLPELESGLHRLSSLVKNDLPLLEDAVKLASSKIGELKWNTQLMELTKILRGDIDKESEFLASPVSVQEKRLYEIPNYGSSMAPFYVVLALWVGSTLLISLFRAEVTDGLAKFKPYQLYFGRLGTFLTVGLFQALSVTLGNLFIVKTYVANPVLYVLFAVLVSIVFVTITYTLLYVFGNVGKGIAIIFMVFQFSSSGGTFPIGMTSPFFQMLNPFMPFTYAISILREAVGGVLWQTVIKDVLCLLGFIGIHLIMALLLKRPLDGMIKKSAENAKKTDIIA